MRHRLARARFSQLSPFIIAVALSGAIAAACADGSSSSGPDRVRSDAALDADASRGERRDAAAPPGSSARDASLHPVPDARHPGDAGHPADASVHASVRADARADARADTDAGPPRLLFGIGIHSGGGNAVANQQIAELLHARNLETVRMDFGTGQKNFDAWRDQVERLRALGIKAETPLFPTFQYSTSCTLDLATTEDTSYAETTVMVNRIKDIVTDFELMNEVMLKAELKSEVTPNDQTPASGYAAKPCYAVKVAVLRGMYRAIRDVARQSGLPLRIIAGTVGRNWGYLDFLREQGIDFDIVGYHHYPKSRDADWDADTWFGEGGLFTQLARYGRPVHFNEYNCGETYATQFENKAGTPTTEACFRTIPKFLLQTLAQKRANIESVHFYELFDEPAQPAPENRFGLWYTATEPKVTAYLASAFAGGALSPSEQIEITSRALLTPAQITAFRAR